MGQYDNAIKLAKQLITKYGEVVTLRTYVEQPNAEKPWEPSAPTPLDQPVEAVFLSFQQQYVDGTQVLAGDQRVFMPAQGLTSPPENDGLVIRTGPVNWKIVRVSPLNPAGDPIMYELQVRQ